MAIFSGGISGGGQNPIPEDLVAIYQGGQNFLARMKVLEDARSASEAALAQLKLGNDLVGAHTEALAKTVDAARLQAAAQKALNDANAQAVAIVDDAKTKAQAMLDTAHTQASDVVTVANAAKADADSYAAKTKALADSALKDASDKAAQAKQLNAASKAQSDAASAAKVAADAARADAEAAKASYEQKVSQIKAVMSSAPAG